MSQNHAAVTSDHGNAPSVAGPRRTLRERLVAARSAVSAAFGSVLAVVPHVLHHIGILAGAAFLTGLGGSLLLGALGLVFAPWPL